MSRTAQALNLVLPNNCSNSILDLDPAGQFPKTGSQHFLGDPKRDPNLENYPYRYS